MTVFICNFYTRRILSFAANSKPPSQSPRMCAFIQRFCGIFPSDAALQKVNAGRAENHTEIQSFGLCALTRGTQP